MLNPELKAQIIKKYAIHTNDTGSLEVQIAILVAEINDIAEHLKQHKKDFSSKRGLIRKVAQRRRFLKELQKESEERFAALMEKINSDKTLGSTEIEELPQA
ncbi:MAG: 30S ribosomal protein S15 [Patescibacteria group bacterium]